MGTEIEYRLAESVIRVSGKRTTKFTTEKEPVEVGSEASDVTVQVVHRAAAGAGARARFDAGGGSTELGVQLTEDGRLESISHNSEGTGSTVVRAGAKVLAFVGSIARAASTGFLAEHVGQGDGAEAPTVDEQNRMSRAAWLATLSDADRAIVEKYTQLAALVVAQLVTLRTEMATCTDPAELRAAGTRERTLERLEADVDAQLTRINAQFAAWRARRHTTMTATLEVAVDIDKLPTTGQSEPSLALMSEESHQLYESFDIVVTIDRPGERSPANPTEEPEPVAESCIRWRVPRLTAVTVWKTSPTGALAVHSRTPAWVVDDLCQVASLELPSKPFGDNGGSLSFRESGAPKSIDIARESGWRAFADALGDTPDQIAAGLGQAQAVRDSWGAIVDADADRAKAAAERDLATAQARLELEGLHATADTHAALKRAERAVELRTAQRAVGSDVDALDDLKLELERAKAEKDLAAMHRAAALEAELAGLSAEVARLAKLVEASKHRETLEGDPASDE